MSQELIEIAFQTQRFMVWVLLSAQVSIVSERPAVDPGTGLLEPFLCNIWISVGELGHLPE